MNDNMTDISVVLDRSGSMSIVQQDTIGGFNTFIKGQKEAPGTASLTLVQFDSEYDIVHNGVDIQQVPDLTTVTYVPRGNTALLDAIGRTIIATGARLAAMPEDARPGKVVFVILTDGEENASREFNRDKINEMIKLQSETYKWDFVFLGANQDAIRAGASMGVTRANSMSYASNAVGTTCAFASVTKNLSAYRSGDASKGSQFFTEADREAQKKAGA